MVTPDSCDLSAVLGGLDELGFEAAIEPDPGAGWIRLDSYASDRLALDAGLRVAGARFGQPEVSPMTGGWLVGEIAAAIAWPATAVMLTLGRGLVTDASEVYVPHPGADGGRAIRFAPRGSPASVTPHAFSHGIVEAMRPVIDSVHDRTRRGPYALWGTVTDMVAAAFLSVGEHLGRGTHARRLADAVVTANPALVGATNWTDISWCGGTRHTHIRNICCLWYRTEGGDLCATCPRVGPEKRRAILERHAVQV